MYEGGVKGLIRSLSPAITMMVVFIASINTLLVYLLSGVKSWNNVHSDSYIACRWLVALVGWLLFSYIAYDVLCVFSHMGDTLLYCFSYNKAVSRNVIDYYCPDTLRSIVGFGDKNTNKFPYYGHAPAGMY